MSEGDIGPSESDGGGGSFWTSLPALITAAAVLLGAVVSAVVTLRDDDSPAIAAATTDTTPRVTTTTSEPASPFVPFTRPAGRLYYEGGTMFVKAARAGRPLLALTETDEAVSDVRLSALIEWVSGAPDYGVGFVCRYVDAGNYYLLSVLSDSRYHVVRYRKGKPVSLTGGIQQSSSVEEGENDVTARCVGDDPVVLTLTANGREIAKVRDPDGIEEGNVGIRLGTSESAVTVGIKGFELASL